MQVPASYIHDHLVWDRRGGTWAIFRVPALTSALHTPRDLRNLHGRLRRLLVSLPAESALWSACFTQHAEEVVARMTSGTDLARHPAFADVADLVLAHLQEFELLKRRYYLAVKLRPASDLMGDVRAVLRAATDSVGRAFGIVPPPRTGRRLQAAFAAAALAEQKIRACIEVQPATAGEIRWLYARAARRGLPEPAFDASWEPRDGRAGRPRLVPIGESTVLLEGGGADDLDRPRHRRYLRIETPYGTSYQTFMVISDMPSSFLFPGGSGEWFARVENLPFPVEWHARVRAVSNEEARVKTKRQARQLADQFDQHGGDTAGPPHTLLRATDALQDEQSRLAASPTEPELQVSIVFTLWSTDLRELEANADLLRDMYAPNEYGVHRPTGDQQALFYATMPAGPDAPVIRDYTQYLLPSDFAAGLPFATAEVGDPRGGLLGYRLGSPILDPVLLDASYGPQVDRSGSIGFCGGLGSGKSYTIKRIAADTLAMGGQVIILDRTRPREYARFAAAAPGTSQVVEITPDAPVCLDPLRVFDAEFARVYAIGFLSLLTGHSPTSDEGALLAEAVDAVLATPRPALRDVVEFLAASDDVMARQVARRLQVFARDRLASLTFHDGAPLRVEADCVVFAVAGLSLPSEQQLRDRHLAGGMLPEQAFSQSLLYLIAAVARTAAFADTTRFAAMLTDEAKALRYSPQGLELLTEMVTDGRKNNAALWVASQQASDMDGTMAELLGTRFAFRQDSRAAAEKAARFVGLRPTDDLLEDMTQMASGQALMRDVRGRVAPVQVIEALDDDLHVAFDTHPGGDERSRRIIELRAETTAPPLPVAPVAGDWDGYDEVAG
ncbi:MAG TPA: ATP-binding protein [Euzebyales bacterium]|nr:ATP-binding protein [Euzebyales bacterium]